MPFAAPETDIEPDVAAGGFTAPKSDWDAEEPAAKKAAPVQQEEPAQPLPETALNQLKRGFLDLAAKPVQFIANTQQAAIDLAGQAPVIGPAWKGALEMLPTPARTAAPFVQELAERRAEMSPVDPRNKITSTIAGAIPQAMGMISTGGVAGIPATLALGGMMGGQQGYETADEIGVTSPLGKLATAAAFGATEAAVERLGGIGGKEVMGSAAKRFLSGLGSEAIEEPLTGAAQDLVTRVAATDAGNGQTATGYDLSQLSPTDPRYWEKRGLETIGGAAGGTIFAGVQALGDLAQPQQQTQEPVPQGPDEIDAAMKEIAGTSIESGESIVPDLSAKQPEVTARGLELHAEKRLAELEAKKSGEWTLDRDGKPVQTVIGGTLTPQEQMEYDAIMAATENADAVDHDSLAAMYGVGVKPKTAVPEATQQETEPPVATQSGVVATPELVDELEKAGANAEVLNWTDEDFAKNWQGMGYLRNRVAGIIDKHRGLQAQPPPSQQVAEQVASVDPVAAETGVQVAPATLAAVDAANKLLQETEQLAPTPPSEPSPKGDTAAVLPAAPTAAPAQESPPVAGAAPIQETEQEKARREYQEYVDREYRPTWGTTAEAETTTAAPVQDDRLTEAEMERLRVAASKGRLDEEVARMNQELSKNVLTDESTPVTGGGMETTTEEPDYADLHSYIEANHPQEAEASRYLDPSAQYKFHLAVWRSAGSPKLDTENAPPTTQRDATKPEQMTPDEYVGIEYNRRITPMTPAEFEEQDPKPKDYQAKLDWSRRRKKYLWGMAAANLPIPKAWVSDIPSQEFVLKAGYVKQGDTFVRRRTDVPPDYGVGERRIPYEYSDVQDWLKGNQETAKLYGESAHMAAVNSAVWERNEPVSAAAVEAYGIKLPAGYQKQGDLYVFQPETTQPQTPTPQPPQASAVQAAAETGVVEARSEEGGERETVLELPKIEEPKTKQPKPKQPKPSESRIAKLVEEYNASGRVAFRYPRKGTISIDGTTLSEADAVSKMERVLAPAKPSAAPAPAKVESGGGAVTTDAPAPPGASPPVMAASDIVPDNGKKASSGTPTTQEEPSKPPDARTQFVTEFAALFPSLPKVSSLTPQQAASGIESILNDGKKRSQIEVALLRKTLAMYKDMVAGYGVTASYDPRLNAVVAEPGTSPSTLAHEVGHLIERTLLKDASPETQKAIRDSYERWLKSKDGGNNLTETDRARFWDYMTEEGWANPDAKYEAGERSKRYITGFKEWFADQVGRWASTNAKPVSLIDKFFSDVAAKLKQFFDRIQQRFMPDKTVADWLDQLSGPAPKSTSKHPDSTSPRTIAPGDSIKFKTEGRVHDGKFLGLTKDGKGYTVAFSNGSKTTVSAHQINEHNGGAVVEGTTTIPPKTLNPTIKRKKRGDAGFIDVEAISHGIELYARGVKDFASWSARMVKRFGEAVRTHLKSIFQSITKGGFTNEQQHRINQWRNKRREVIDSIEVPKEGGQEAARDFFKRYISALYAIGKNQDGSMSFGDYPGLLPTKLLFTENPEERTGVTTSNDGTIRINIGLVPQQFASSALAIKESMPLAADEEVIHLIETIASVGDKESGVAVQMAVDSLSLLIEAKEAIKSGDQSLAPAIEGSLVDSWNKYNTADNVGSFDEIESRIGENPLLAINIAMELSRQLIQFGRTGDTTETINQKLIGDVESLIAKSREALLVASTLARSGAMGGLLQAKIKETEAVLDGIKNQPKFALPDTRTIANGDKVKFRQEGTLLMGTYQGVNADGTYSVLVKGEKVPRHVSARSLNENNGGAVVEGTRFAYAGEKSNMPKMMRDSLEAAKAMAAAGRSREEIRAVTGWFPGFGKGNEKLRYEVPDDGAKMTRRLPKIGETMRLDQVIKHDALFAAYPQLGEYKVVGTDHPNLGMVAAFNLEDKTFEIDPRHTAFAFGGGISTMIHEVQHAIQSIEGFANGSNPASIKAIINGWKSPAEAYLALEEIDKAVRKNVEPDRRNAAFYQNDKFTTVVGMGNLVAKDKEIREALEAVVSPEQQYRRTAGEIESRDIQARRNFTAEQRKAIAPYSSENIAEKDAIVMFGSGAQASINALPTGNRAMPLDKARAHVYNKLKASPRKVRVINEPSLKFRGRYDPDSSITLNSAYLGSVEELNDVLLNHESIHDAIETDSKVRQQADKLLGALTDDELTDIEAEILDYKDGEFSAEQVQAERQVEAIRKLTANRPDLRSAWGRLVESVSLKLKKMFGGDVTRQQAELVAARIVARGLKRLRKGKTGGRVGGGSLYQGDKYGFFDPSIPDPRDAENIARTPSLPRDTKIPTRSSLSQQDVDRINAAWTSPEASGWFTFGRTDSSSPVKIAEAYSTPENKVTGDDVYGDGSIIVFTGSDGGRAVVNVNDRSSGKAVLNMPKSSAAAGQLYQAALTYLHNNNLTRQHLNLTDRNAGIRLVSNMLSSALRHGTTRHLDARGVLGIEWRKGDDAWNIAQLANYERVYVFGNLQPGEIAAVLASSNLNGTSLAGSDAQVLADTGTGEMAEVLTRAARYGIGTKTVARAAVTASAIQGKDGAIREAADRIAAVKPLYQASPSDVTRFKQLTASIPPKPTAEQLETWKQEHPAEYKELEAMREKVLREMGYDTETPLVHHTFSNFNTFKLGGNKRPYGEGGWSGNAVWLEPESIHLNRKQGERPPIAHTREFESRLKGESAAQTYQRMKTLRLYAKTNFPLGIHGASGSKEAMLEKEAYGVNKSFPLIITDSDLVVLNRMGRDSAYAADENGKIREVVVFSPSQIKSADPLATDDSGNLIDPSQWGDETSPDIRYASTNIPAAGSEDSQPLSPTDNSLRAREIREAAAGIDWGTATRSEKKAAVDAFGRKTLGRLRAGNIQPDATIVIASGDGESAHARFDGVIDGKTVVVIQNGYSGSVNLANAEQAMAHAYDSSHEEMIHALQSIAAVRRWKKAGSVGEAEDFVRNEAEDALSEIKAAFNEAKESGNAELASKIDALVVDSWNLYNRNKLPSLDAVIAEIEGGAGLSHQQFYSEVTRKLMQVSRNDFTTETGWQRFVTRVKALLETVINRLKDALNLAKKGTLGPTIKQEITDLETMMKDWESSNSKPLYSLPKPPTSPDTYAPSQDPTGRTRQRRVLAGDLNPPTGTEVLGTVNPDGTMKDVLLGDDGKPVYVATSGIYDKETAERIIEASVPLIESIGLETVADILMNPQRLLDNGIVPNSALHQGVAMEAQFQANQRYLKDPKNPANQSLYDKTHNARERVGTEGGQSQGIRGALIGNERYQSMFITEALYDQIKKGLVRGFDTIMDAAEIATKIQEAVKRAEEAARSDLEDMLTAINPDIPNTVDPPVTIETPPEMDKDEKKARSTAESIITEAANRLGDPPVETQKQADLVRELYKKHVGNRMGKQEFEAAAVALKLNPAVAYRLWNTGNTERTARETITRYKQIEAEKRKQEAADKKARRLIYETMKRMRQSGYNEANKKQADSILKAFNDQVKKPESLAKFQARLRNLRVSGEASEALFETAKKEAADRAKMQAFKDRKALLEKDSPVLASLLNRLKGDVSWKEILGEPRQTMRERMAGIFDRVRKHEALQDLSPAEQETLTKELERLLQKQRLKQVNKDLNAAGLNLPKKAEKVVRDSMPELLRLINTGTFSAETFRDAIAPKFGLKTLSSGEVKRVEAIAAKINDAPAGMPKRQLQNELLTTMQDITSATKSQIALQYWVSSVLSGGRTQFDTPLSFLNGTRKFLQGASLAAMKGEGKVVGQAFQRYFKGLHDGMMEAAYYFRTGDPTMLLNFDAEMNAYLKGGQNEAHPYRLSEKIWNDAKKSGNWLKIPPAAVIMSVNRMMQSWDHINARATSRGFLPLAVAFNRKLYSDLKVPDQADFKAAEQQAEQFLGKPKTWGEKVKVKAMANEILDASVSEDNKVRDTIINEAIDIGRTASYQNDPTGIIGTLYHGIKNTTANIIKKAEAAAQEAGKTAAKTGTKSDKAKATAMNLVAFSSRFVEPIAGTMFLRFVGNRFNELISLTPGLGAMRLWEKEMNQTKRAMIYTDQAVGSILYALGAVALYAMLSDDDDEDKRGWRIEGGWQGVDKAKQRQMLSEGRTPYSLAFKNADGSWGTLKFGNWPVASILATVGGMSDKAKYRPKEWNEDSYAAHIANAIFGGITAISDISAISALMETLGGTQYGKDPVEGLRDRVNATMANFTGGFIPRGLKDLDYLSNPAHNKPDDLMSFWLKEIPVYRRSVGAPMMDVFGRQVQLRREPWSRAYLPGPIEPEYQIAGRMASRGLFLPLSDPDQRVVGKGKNRRSMTDEEKGQYLKEAGEAYKDFVLRYGEKVLDMEPDKAREFIASKLTEARNRAEQRAVR